MKKPIDLYNNIQMSSFYIELFRLSYVFLSNPFLMFYNFLIPIGYETYFLDKPYNHRTGGRYLNNLKSSFTVSLEQRYLYNFEDRPVTTHSTRQRPIV